MDYTSLLMVVGVALLKLLVGLLLTLFSVYYGVRFFDSLTRNIEEWKEIRKGNAAVGMMLGAVILSIAALTMPGIFVLSNAIDPMVFSWKAVGIGVIAYLLAFFISLFSVYISIRLLDVIESEKINKIAALKKGNLAMGIFIAAIILSISAVIFLLEVSSLFSFFPILIG